MTLSDIASLVEILGILAVVFGLWIGLIQLRMHRKQQRDLAIMECARVTRKKISPYFLGMVSVVGRPTR